MEDGSEMCLDGEIKNCRWWSDMVVVTLLESMSCEMTLLKILSIRVLKLLLFQLG